MIFFIFCGLCLGLFDRCVWICFWCWVLVLIFRLVFDCCDFLFCFLVVVKVIRFSVLVVLWSCVDMIWLWVVKVEFDGNDLVGEGWDVVVVGFMWGWFLMFWLILVCDGVECVNCWLFCMGFIDDGDGFEVVWLGCVWFLIWWVVLGFICGFVRVDCWWLIFWELLNL